MNGFTTILLFRGLKHTELGEGLERATRFMISFLATIR